MVTEPTKLDELIQRVKNNRALAVVLLIAIGAIGVGQVIDSFEGISQTLSSEERETEEVSLEVIRAKAMTALKESGVPFTRDTFVKAAREGDYEQVRLFLDAGMEPDVKQSRGNRFSALCAASLEGRGDVARLLVSAGADLELECEGFTPLMLAALRGQDQVVGVLVERGASVHQKGDLQATALLWAANNCHLTTVQSLLRAGADPNARAEGGEVPLMIAYSSCREDKARRAIMTALIAEGADVDARNNEGESVPELAREENDAAIVQLLTTLHDGRRSN
jgi:ankyrin repeat protein